MPEKQIELIARAFIFQDGEVLLCRAKGKEHFFFPGGHVEYGEYIEEALRREIGEELDTQITLCDVIGTAENIFIQDGQEHHEINVVFEAGIREKKSKALEHWMEFCWMGEEKLPEAKIFPTSLKKAIIQWKKDKKTFWVKQNDIK